MTTDPLIGTEIGRFRVERLLGQGGMGAVYLGVQQAIGSRVAIKVLSAECARDAGLLDRFFAEARSVNLIRHEGIVSVIDLAQLPDGRPYIVMEFIEGHTLGELVRTASPLPIGGVVQVVTEMLSALAAAHERGIVHRDLKPDNVIVTREGHAKVLDFGIAKLSPGLASANSPRTATGALLGTPAYMAPEQITGAQNVDARTDLYAVGVMLFELVTGAAPFAGATLFDLMRAHLDEAPPSPSLLRPDLPPAVQDVILMALAKRADDRFQSAAAMSEALRHAATALPGEQWRTLSGKVLTGRPSLQQLAVHTPRDLMPRATPVPAPLPSSSPPAPLLPAKTEAMQGSRAGLYVALGLVVAAVIGVSALIATQRTPAAPSPAQVPRDAGEVVAEIEVPVDAPVTRPARPPAPVALPATPGNPTTPVMTPSPRARAPVVTQDPATNVTTVAPPQPGGEVHIAGTLSVGEKVPDAKLRRRPASYNVRQFDALAFAPQALAFARELYADAGLVSLEFAPVAPSGLVDLTHEAASAEYMFRSPSHAGECYVEVTASATQVLARIRDHSGDAKCRSPIRAIPRCTPATVYRKTPGVLANQALKISFLTDGKWFSSNLGDDDNNISETIDCP